MIRPSRAFAMPSVGGWNGKTQLNLQAIRNAKRGKTMSRFVAGGVVGAGVIGTMKNRSGRAVDRVTGRPTGVYQF